MKRNAIAFLSALFGILIGGCATQASLQPGELRFKRIGVVSVIGDTFTRRYTGITIFGDESEEREVSAWRLDSVYADQLGHAAAAVFGGTYVRGNYSREQFAQVNGDPVSLNDHFPHWVRIEESAKKYCRDYSLDTMLVVAKWYPTIPGTPMRLYSVGMQSRLTWALIYSAAQIGIIDCATGKPRRLELLTEEDGVLAISYVFRDIPRELGAVSVERWDAATESDVRERMASLPSKAWERTLRRTIGGER